MTFHCRHLPQSQCLISAFEHLLHSGTEDQHVREKKEKKLHLRQTEGALHVYRFGPTVYFVPEDAVQTHYLVYFRILSMNPLR
jgi:hypothetical protein